MVLANYAKAISSYDKESSKIAKDVPDEDRAINSIYETCFREHLHIMMEDRDSIGFCTQMLFIAKELERIGDLSKVISKEVLYNVEGVIK
jgi:phosphate transport system protein